MQRIKLDVFQTLFTKNLTGNEIDFILALSHMQDERGCVCGLHYKEMMAETGMSAQAFYDCKKSLQEKRVIEVRPGNQDYDICLLGNDFTAYTGQDYSEQKVKYVKTNSKLFADGNWKRLKPAQKLLAMDLYHISRASKGRTYRIGQAELFGKVCRPEEPGRIHPERKTGDQRTYPAKVSENVETLFLYRDQRGNVLYHTPERICRGSRGFRK